MSEISAAAVKALRDRTNAPMMDCKQALVEAKGDINKAIEVLRQKNSAIQAKKGERETAEGRIAVYVDQDKKLGAIVEVRCESAPVAKSKDFIKLADDIARQVAVKGAESVEALLAQPCVDDSNHTVNERIAEVVGMIRENMKPARMTRLTGLVGGYAHHNGSVGVLVQVEGAKADPQLLRDVAMHITAKNPVAGRREDVPAAQVEKEREIARSQAAALGKPAQIAEKIAEGKLKTWFAENVLVEQPFVRDDSKNPKTVGELLQGAGLSLVRFVRYAVGEIA
jgi:elongation factor Ts